MTKKFKVVIDDSGLEAHWQVWHVNGSMLEYMYAEFFGNHCRQYAREHARRLNALPEREKP